MSAVLDVVGLRKTFDNIHVIRGIDLSAEQGERHAIIGPNGAGKSTLFHLISGRLSVTDGTIQLLRRTGHREPAAVQDRPHGARSQLSGDQHLSADDGPSERSGQRAVVDGGQAVSP